MTRHLHTAAALLAILTINAACVAGEIYIRLIDPVAKAPLEFRQNDAKLPSGGKMLLRFPTAIYVDGKPIEYERYGIQQTDGSSDEEAAQDNALDLGDELVKDLGGGAPPEPEIEADRKNEILGGDGPTPATMGSVWASAGVASFDVIHGERVQKLREVFEQKYGAIGVDVSEAEKLNQPTEKDREEMAGRNAWGFKVGEEIKMKITGGDDKALLWSQWVNDLYPESFRTCRGLLARMIPDPLLTCGTTWGFGAGGGMYPGTLYRALDFPLNDMHGDYGVCNFCYITGTDILTMGMEEPSARPWIGLDMITVRERANGYKLLLEALSRNPAGVGVLNLTGGDWICAWAADKSRSEDLADLTEIARRIGPVFPKLQRQDEIAVVSSFRQEVLGGQPFRALWAAHYVASKAGYQAAIITDVFCETHPDRLAKLCKAVLLFGMAKPLSPGFRAALAAYQKAGGMIIADKASDAVDLPDVVRLPFAIPSSHGPSNSNDHLEFEEFFIPLIKQFADTVRPSLAPFFAFESHLKIHNHEINFTGIRSTDGDLQYLTIFNDGKPNIENGTHAQFLYQGDKATVTLPKRSVLYDALRRVAVETKPAGDGMQFTCDATLYPGSVYVLAERPIAALEVAHTAKAAPGETMQFRVRTQDPDGKPFTGRLPIELTVRDPAGAIRYQIYRTTEQNIDLKIAGNDPPGKWSWTALDQATGLKAGGPFDVAGEVKPPAVAPIGELVFDADAVHDLLQQEVQIVLFPSDQPLQPAAEQLLADLQKRGAKASIRTLWPAQFRNYPMQWFYHTIEDVELRAGVLGGSILGSRIEGKNHKGTYMRDNFGNYAFYKHYTGSAPLVYYRNVILLGRGDVPANPMLGLIKRGRMLWRNPSPSFPAAGQGMVGYAFGPFHSGHDAIVLYGNDAAGLQNAAASLVRLAEAKERPARRFTPNPSRREPENGQVFASMGCTQSAGEKASVRGTERESRSLLPPIYARQVKEVVCDDAGRILVHQAGEQADLALIDPVAKQARQLKLPDGFAPISARAFAWHLGPGAGKLWPPDGMQPVGDDFITTTEWGIGRFDKAGKPVWICDPFPLFNNYNEVKFPRRVHKWILSGDRGSVLADFINKTPSQGEPTFFHRPDVTLLDAATGKPRWTAETYYGDFLALAKDGSRGVMLDLEDPFRHISPRTVPNVHRTTGLAMFDRTGEKLFLPMKGPVDRLLVDDAATVAVITYNDARRCASIVDLDTGTIADHSYPRIDVGAAVAPDGSWLVLTYSDGAVHKIDRTGKLAWKAALPEPGVPAISPKDGTVTVISAGGTATVIAADDGKIAQTIEFGKAAVEPLNPEQPAPPKPLEPPAPAPFWQAPPQGIKKTELKDAPFAEPAAFAGEQKVTVNVPAMAANQTLLVCFRYQLKDPASKLVVTMSHGGKPLTYRFPYHLRPWPAWIPIRSEELHSVELTFLAPGGVTLQDGRIVVLKTEDWTNVSPTPSPDSGGTDRFKISDNRNVPRVMVPNIYAQIGDPRVEQMAYGTKTTNVFKLFDVDVFTGTDLYEIEYPLNDGGPSELERNLRGARIVMEYDRPRIIRALAIWEQHGDVPNESYALECCDNYEIDEKMTKELKADWEFVCGVRDNTDYFHLHAFPPTKAKVWRLSILRTQAKMQRLAEVELYEEAMESLFDLDEGGDGGMMDEE